MTRRLVLWALLLTTTVGVLAAEDWRVQIIALNPRADLLLDTTGDVATAYGCQLALSEARLLRWQARRDQAAKTLADQARHALYAAGDERALAQVVGHETSPGELPTCIAYTAMPYSPSLARLVRSGDEAVSWYMEREGLDSLILLDVQRFDDFDRVVCTAVEEGSVILLDRLVPSGSFHELEEELSAAFLGYSSAHTKSALLVTDGPLSLTITLDGVVQKPGERLFILAPGTIHLAIAAPSHTEREELLHLEEGRVTRFDATLDKVAEEAVTVRSQSGRVSWFVNGVLMDANLSLTIEEPVYPLSILATKEGFANQEIGLAHAPAGDLVITMAGEKSLSPASLKQEQEDFYKQLRKTILLFGAYVAAVALGSAPALEHPFWQVGQVASGGVALVNLVLLVAQLATYAR
ncbi:MAG: hypothetical protein RBS49_05590 [Sphaerochaeta sp.]|jgi:hypothetical protein|nr:hypothetical protein [Sphaerochaeta sp.]